MKFFVFLFMLLSLGSEANDCAQDKKKFCSGIEPGKGQIAKCLSDYQEQLSAKCSAELKEFKKETGSINPCFEDLADYCSDLPLLPRRVEYCLLRNESKLSQRCSADFLKKKGHLVVKDVCAQDIAQQCYQAVSGPEAGIVRCLIKNQNNLSPFCQKTIQKKIAGMKKSNPCFEDTEKFCPQQVLFADIHECMTKKMSALNPLCKKVVQDEIDKEKTNPCYKDLRRHCKQGLSSSDQEHCLGLNEKELSNSCLQFRLVESQRLKKLVDVCEEDRIKFCPKAPFQNGMILKCLKENLTQISTSCKNLMK
jgi:hypothetical protein